MITNWQEYMDSLPTEERVHLRELQDEYSALAHAMQSGVKFKEDKSDQSHKHLRVGVNSAMCESSALQRLLVAKGLITWVEYFEYLCQTMAEEVQKYKESISREQGVDPDTIKLA